MNIASKTTWFVWVFCVFLAAQTASAYYDPGVQRWINRDRIGEKGVRQVYSFLRNDPLIMIDLFGLWATFPPDAGENTVVCDGKGGFKIQYSNKNAASTSPCVFDCLLAHEMSHLADIKKAAPDICKNQPPGTIIGAEVGTQLNDTEIKGHNAEIECLKDYAANPCPACPRLELLNRLSDVMQNKKQYEQDNKKPDK